MLEKWNNTPWMTYICSDNLLFLKQKTMKQKRLFLVLLIMAALPLSSVSDPCMSGCISGLSVLFHWSICLFLCQYYAVKSVYYFQKILCQKTTGKIFCRKFLCRTVELNLILITGRRVDKSSMYLFVTCSNKADIIQLFKNLI